MSDVLAPTVLEPRRPSAGALWRELRLRWYRHRTAEFLARNASACVLAALMLGPALTGGFYLLGLVFLRVADGGWNGWESASALAASALVCTAWLSAQGEALRGGALRTYAQSLPLTRRERSVCDALMIAIAIQPLWLLLVAGLIFAPWPSYSSAQGIAVATRLVAAALAVAAGAVALITHRWSGLLLSVGSAAAIVLSAHVVSSASILVAAASALVCARVCGGGLSPATRWRIPAFTPPLPAIEPLALMQLRYLGGERAPASALRLLAALGIVAAAGAVAAFVDPDQATWWILLAGGLAATVLSSLYHPMADLRIAIREVLEPLPLRPSRVFLGETALVAAATLAVACPAVAVEMVAGRIAPQAIALMIVAWLALPPLLRPAQLRGGDSAPALAAGVWLLWSVVILDLARCAGWTTHGI
jgi:hypothetical protein